jgi:hypothetical protein
LISRITPGPKNLGDILEMVGVLKLYISFNKKFSGGFLCWYFSSGTPEPGGLCLDDLFEE